jgi:hypothetical protein
MEVSMVVIPKSKTDMVHRATKAPVAAGAKTEALAPDAPANPSDMKFKTEDAREAKGDERAKDTDADRRRLLLALMTSDAPEGVVDQVASDPDSESDVAINATGTGTATDPELARYVASIEALFKKNFFPLPTILISNPDIMCEVAVTFDLSTGKLTGYNITKPSENASYDGAAERAVQAVTKVPLPPEKYKARFTDGYLVRYKGDK